MKTQQSSAPRWNPAQKVQNPPDFSGRDLFVGIDVHKQRWQVAVYYEGLILSNSSIAASAEALVEHLRKRYGEAHFHCVYESGPFGFSLCRSLWAAGLECTVVNPADVPGTDKERRSKTDKVDARKLSMHLSAGLLTPIHVPSEKLQKQRSLVRFRKRLVGDLTRAKNRLKSELRFQGIGIPECFDKPHWSRNFLRWIEEQAGKDEDLRDTLRLMLEQARLLRGLLLQTERRLRELMAGEAFNKNSRLLRAIPAVGPQLTTVFLLEVGDVGRFGSFDQLNRYVGLCPDEHSSGDTQWRQGISHRKHNQLRGLLVEAAWQLIRTDPAMLDHYQTLLRRMKGQEAIIRIARKLLRRIRAVLLSGKVYVRGISGNLCSKDIEAPSLPAPKKRGRPKKEVTA